ncbi:hypothetical protein GS966_25435 [Rhodococcus hoagii]|nr:hypothetical protein [Prescottella equi]NKS61650.1 hypothetical protein [Prescottella equi]NKZ93245.1 hypothetical protein [Prescottella equi]
MEDSRAATIERLRLRMAAIPAGSSGPTRTSLAALTSAPPADDAEEITAPSRPSTSLRTLPAPGPVADLLPHRGLVRGSTVHVSGAASLRAGLIASVTEAGGSAAIVGLPRLSLLAAAEMGADLRRCAVVEEPGTDPIEVAAVLADGLDFILLSLGGVDVPPSRARAVAARVRKNGTILAVTDGRWPSTDLQLDARVARYHGLDAGYGRITGIDLDVQATPRGNRPRRSTITLTGHGGRIEWNISTTSANTAAPLRIAQ